MAAIDPTANAEGDGPKLATLKIVHRPFATEFKFGDYLDDYEEDSEDDEDDEEEEEEEEETPKKSDKKNAAKAIQKLLDEASAMEVDSKKGGKKNAKKAAKEDSEEEDDEEDSDDEDDEDVEVEESVVCTLDPARVSSCPESTINYCADTPSFTNNHLTLSLPKAKKSCSRQAAPSQSTFQETTLRLRRKIVKMRRARTTIYHLMRMNTI